MTTPSWFRVGGRITFTGYGYGVSRDDANRAATILGFTPNGRVRVQTDGADGRTLTVRADMLRRAS